MNYTDLYNEIDAHDDFINCDIILDIDDTFISDVDIFNNEI